MFGGASFEEGYKLRFDSPLLEALDSALHQCSDWLRPCDGLFGRLWNHVTSSHLFRGQNLQLRPGMPVSEVSCHLAYPWKDSPPRRALGGGQAGGTRMSPQNRGAPLLCSLTGQEPQGPRKKSYAKGRRCSYTKRKRAGTLSMLSATPWWQ